jgi:hypothetical protein
MLAEPYSEEACESCRSDQGRASTHVQLRPAEPTPPPRRRVRESERSSNFGVYSVAVIVVAALVALVVSVWLGMPLDPRSLLAMILLGGLLLRILLVSNQKR